MSETKLEDGRTIFIGGEHEDFYDDDFCIYNDVIVFNSEDDWSIYGYPKEVFPPTDFHSATLIGNGIYIIGGLGYKGERNFQETLVFRLDLKSLKIEAIETYGKKPGWIHQHESVYLERENCIYVSGGLLSTLFQGKEIIFANVDDYVLHLSTMTWDKV
ncbi:Kelch repeat-containing protein [Myxosarcina sp. GI1(2024)]